MRAPRFRLVLPHALILNGWLLDWVASRAIAPLLNPFRYRAGRLNFTSALWANYDFVSKWLIYGLVAWLLVTQGERLHARGKVWWLACWASVAALMFIEIWGRHDFNYDWLQGRDLRAELIIPCTTTNGWAHTQPMWPQIVLWAARPLWAFLTVSIVTVLWRGVARRIQRGQTQGAQTSQSAR